MITVVAALIERDGKLLICQRRRDDAFALKWEFPGGKVHPNETPTDALVRELREELGVEAMVGAEVYRTRHRYLELAKELELLFYRVSLPPRAVPRNLAFERMDWASRESLPGFDFLPADLELITKLASGEIVLHPATKTHADGL